MGRRILIIKIGALGDVVRTACLLPTLKRMHPQSHITWITKPEGARILWGHPMIDRLFAFDAEGILAVGRQEFDLVLSLDKEPAPTALCNAVQAPDKRGIRMSRWGTAEPCGRLCKSYLELGLDDDLKFRGNRLTYPELIHRALGLKYVREPYYLPCDEETLNRAASVFRRWRRGVSGRVVGLNIGAGSMFANKAPSRSRWAKVAEALRKRGRAVVLLGGPDEARDMDWLLSRVRGLRSTGCNNSEREFVGLVSQCDAVITGDTLGLHVAVARGVPVVALFGPTCEQEIDLFDRGTKIVTSASCGPCYRRRCDKEPSCMEMIPVERIVASADDVLGQRAAGACCRSRSPRKR